MVYRVVKRTMAKKPLKNDNERSENLLVLVCSDVVRTLKGIVSHLGAERKEISIFKGLDRAVLLLRVNESVLFKVDLRGLKRNF